MWVKLEGFQLDDENAVFDFSTRLARENGWTRAYTARVIQEYKRFLLLAMHAGHPVTPSGEVDQAWHLHLVYTRSYWEDLCRDTLGRPLHHGPTQGGETESDKFADWYEKTRDSYARLFNAEPPADIWPPGEARFDATARFERVDRSRFWLLPKFGLRKPAMAAGLAACGSGSLLDGDAFFVAALIGLFGGVAFLAYKSSKNGGGRGGNSSGGTSSCGTGGCGTNHHSGCSSHGGDSGCGSSGCGGGCGGGGD